MSLYKTLIAAGISLPLLFTAASAQADQNTAEDGQSAVVEETVSDSQAPPPAEPAAQPVAEKVAENEKVTCKFITIAGSRLGKKVCGTKKEWDAMRRESQDSVADTQRRATPYATKE